jgi:hypothetical protein
LEGVQDTEVQKKYIPSGDGKSPEITQILRRNITGLNE